MATRAFLLCGDEKAVHAVTQIMDELEVSFEHSSEPAFSLKRLASQKFDLLIVDCDNVQNATQVFNSARASNLNKNSIAIAIVEGKAGVPNAFRLGASLVLTKPVSLEQVRNTLRTGIGMTRKDGPEAKAIAPLPTAAAPAPPAPLAPAIPAITNPGTAPVAAAPTVSRSVSVVSPASPASEAAPKAAASTPVAPKPAPVVPRPVAPAVPAVQQDKPAPSAAETKPVLVAAAPPAVKVVAASATPAKNFDSIFSATPAVNGAPPAKAETKKSETKNQDEEELKAALGSSASLPEPKSKLIAEEDLSLEEDLGVPSFGGMGKQPFAGGEEPEEKKSGRGMLIAALLLIVLGGAGYGAWATQPPVRKFVAWEYLNLSSKIAAIRGQAPANAPAPVQPVAQAPVTPQPPAPAPVVDATAPIVDPNASAMNPATGPSVVAANSPSSGSTNAAPADSTTQKTPTLESAKQDTTPNHAGANPALVAAAANIPPTPAAKSSGSDFLEVPEDFADDQVVHRVHPNYPKQARARKLHGTVVLEAVVNKQGKVDSLQLVSGDPVLAQAAADAVKQWRYKPYMHNGEYTDFQTRVTVDFKQP
jgi:protein TonB